MVNRIVLVHSDRGRVVDGIRDYSDQLGAELSHKAFQVEQQVHTPRESGEGVQRLPSALLRVLYMMRELRRADRGSVIVLQYSPFCFARWGFAPWLPLWFLAVRTRRNRPALALMVHETHVPMQSWRWALMGLWQRVQLSALRLTADVVFTSIEPWAVTLEAQIPRRPVHHLPVGSNFPDSRSKRDAVRRQLGVDDRALVVATFGRSHPSWLGEYVVAAANAISATGMPLVLLVMGAEAPELAGLDPSIAVHAPGYLEAEELGGMLAASDLFLAPLIDGVSTRRGTVMAALQHGLPVVGTSGPLTDDVLREVGSALRLIPVGSAERFANEAMRLAGDPIARTSAGTASRLMYERNFDWPVIADKLLDALPER